MVMISSELLKRPVRQVLGLIGFRLIRVDRTFGLDPLVDILYHYPERSIKTALDVGANVGSFSTRLAKRFPNVRVLAFEPIQSTFLKLKSETARLGTIETFHLALGDTEGEETVYLQENSEWNSLAVAVNRPSTTARSVVVRVRTLDRMADEGLFTSIDLLKTDTEGFDMSVLEGAKSLLGSGRVGFVLSEVAYDLEDKGHTNFFELYEYLANYGFRLFAIYDQTIIPNKRQAGYCNALFVSSSPPRNLVL